MGCGRRQGLGVATVVCSVWGGSVVVVVTGAGAFTKRKTSDWSGIDWTRRGGVCAQ